MFASYRSESLLYQHGGEWKRNDTGPLEEALPRYPTATLASKLYFVILGTAQLHDCRYFLKKQDENKTRGK
jgi:hypothetical protein